MDISRLLSPYAAVRIHHDLQALAESIRSLNDAVVVVDFRDRPHGMLETLRLIAAQAPHTPIVGRVGSEYDTFGMTVEALEVGLAGVWIAGIEDGPSAVRYVFDHAVARSVGALMTNGVEQIDHPVARHFLRLCFYQVMRPCTVSEMTKRMGVNGRALSRALGQCGLPRAEALMVSARVLVATRLLQNPQRKVTEVASAMAVRDVKVFRRQLARLAGVGFVKARNTDAYQIQVNRWQEWLVGSAMLMRDGVKDKSYK